MNKKKIVVLASVLVLLIGLLVVVLNLPEADNDPVSSDGGTPVSNSVTVYNVGYETITSVSVSTTEGAFTLKKDGDRWVCVGRAEADISSSAVLSLLTGLSSLKAEDETDAMPSDCGITQTSDTVSFDYDAGSITLTVGSDVPDSSLVYLGVSTSDKVYMVKKDIVMDFLKPIDEYRNNDLHRVDFENLTSIDIQTKNMSVSLIKGEYDTSKGLFYTWNIISPIKIFARDTEIDALVITPLSKLQSQKCVSDSGEFAAYGLGAKDCFITLKDNGGKSQKMYYSDSMGVSRYVCFDGEKSIYEINASDIPIADKNLIDIADRQLYLNHQSNMDKVTISGDGKDYVVDFSEGSELSVNGKSHDDSTAGREVFTAVTALYADDIFTQTPGKALFNITYTLVDGSDVVLEFAEIDSRYYSVTKNGTPLYTILRSKLEAAFEVLDKYK